MYYFTMTPFVLDECGQVCPLVDYDGVTDLEFVDTRSFRQIEQVLEAAAKTLKPTFEEGVAQNAQGVFIAIKDTETDNAVQSIRIDRGALVCPGCGMIDQFDHCNMDRGQGEWVLLFDRQEMKVKAGTVGEVSSLRCENCNSIHPIDELITGIDMLGYDELGIRYISQRGKK